ncbi:SURF1 family protein [bacterium]|nr:SURF1 family protein [bacterium]
MALVALGVAVLVGLGVWQVQRLAWKTDLIAQVTARLVADPVAAPAPAEAAGVPPYTRVSLRGTYDFAAEVLVQAVTERGAGFWVLTPLKTEAGWTVLINRGFVPRDRRDPSQRQNPAGLQEVTGLLRATEPGGAFLHSNDPGAGRWYSRDVAAIAKAQSLGPVAPYFLDAAAGPDATALPVGGLTVVRFRNAHLAYALTWFGLALLLAVSGGYALSRRASPRL